MAKITLDGIVSGFKSVAKLISNFDSIEDNLNNKVLYRDNPEGEPNQMESELDMNSNRILNLPTATSATEPLTYGQYTGQTGPVQFEGTVVENQLGSEAVASVFTLTTTTFTPGLQNLAVYINGVRQLNSTYVETSTTQITFSTAPVATDEYTFVVNERAVDADSYLASSVVYTTPGSIASNVQAKLQQTVSVEDFDTIAEAVSYCETNDKVLLVDEDTTVQIPSDSATLQIALDHIVPSGPNRKITLNIETGHALTAGFRVEEGDYSAFEITSTDATVSVDASMTLVSNTDLESDVPRSSSIAFLIINAKAPVWNILVDTSNQSVVTGLEYDYNSSGVVRAGKGVINTSDGGTAGVNLRVTSSSTVQAAQSNFSGANADCVMFQTSSRGNLQDADCSGAVLNACLDVSRGCVVHCKDADLSGSGGNTEGLYSRRSFVSAQGVDVSNSSTGISASVTSVVSAYGAVFDGCTTDVRATDGSSVDVTSATKSSSALDPSNSIVAIGGGTVSLRQFNVMQGSSTITNSDVDNEKETLTGTATASHTAPLSYIDSSGGAVTATLGGDFTTVQPGFIKTFVMSNASNSSTLSVTDHETSDPEVFTFSALDDTVVLCWTRREWITLKLSGATV